TRLFDMTNPSKPTELLSHSRPSGTALAFAPNENNLAVVRPDASPRVFDAENDRGYRQFDLQRVASQGGRCLAYSPDGSLLAVGSQSSKSKFQEPQGLIALWDAKTGKLLREFGGHPRRGGVGVVSLAFSPNGKYLAYAEAKTVSLCHVETGTE